MRWRVSWPLRVSGRGDGLAVLMWRTLATEWSVRSNLARVERAFHSVWFATTQPDRRHTDMALHGKTALITGGTSGIGRAVAERLASEGVQVIITGRDQARGREVVEAIEDAGGTARFIA